MGGEGMTMTKAKERPILFTGAMVRAILAGTKTQTRRIVKLVPAERDGFASYRGEALAAVLRRCPYGVVGDRLWVREACYYDYTEKVPKVKPENFDADAFYYRADGECCQQIAECACAEVGPLPWTPSIHMPRWASRITLEITDVRVQRLQEISEEDAIAEGVPRSVPCVGCDGSEDGCCVCEHTGRVKVGDGSIVSAKGEYRALWNEINGAGSWDTNPWVWAISFKRQPAQGGEG